jgi:hypothetical protein
MTGAAVDKVRAALGGKLSLEALITVKEQVTLSSASSQAHASIPSSPIVRVFLLPLVCIPMLKTHAT